MPTSTPSSIQCSASRWRRAITYNAIASDERSVSSAGTIVACTSALRPGREAQHGGDPPPVRLHPERSAVLAGGARSEARGEPPLGSPARGLGPLRAVAAHAQPHGARVAARARLDLDPRLRNPLERL